MAQTEFKDLKGEDLPKFKKTGAVYLERSELVLLKAGSKKAVPGYVWRYTREHVDYHSKTHAKGEMSFELADGSWEVGFTSWQVLPG